MAENETLKDLENTKMHNIIMSLIEVRKQKIENKDQNSRSFKTETRSSSRGNNELLGMQTRSSLKFISEYAKSIRATFDEVEPQVVEAINHLNTGRGVSAKEIQMFVNDKLKDKSVTIASLRNMLNKLMKKGTIEKYKGRNNKVSFSIRDTKEKSKVAPRQVPAPPAPATAKKQLISPVSLEGSTDVINDAISSE